MPTLRIGDQSVQVDDGFLKLSPEQQNATVEEIAQSLPKATAKPPQQKVQPSITDAVTDIPNEIGNAASENWQAIKQGLLPSGQGARGPIDNLLATGRGVAAIPGLIMSPITGAARSIGGHLLEQGTHAVGSVIAPEIAAKEDRQKNYETAKGDVDLAMAAAASRGRPAPVAPAVQAPSEGQAVVDAAGRLSALGNDVNVPRAIASDNIAVQRVGQGIRNIPVVGDAIPKATLQLTEDLGNTVRGVADQYGAGSGPNVANRVGRNIGDAAEAETAAARAAAQRSDDAVLADWQRSTDAAGQDIASREAGALQRARQSVGDMSPQDMGQTLIARLRTGEQAAEANKTLLYQQAGEGNATVSAEAVGGSHNHVNQALHNEGFIVDPPVNGHSLTPASARMMDELGRFSRLEIGNKVTGSAAAEAGTPAQKVGVNVQGIEQTRKRLSAMRQAAQNPTDQRSAGRIMRAFDEWESNSVERALISGDPEALQAYKQARGANTEWRQRFFNDDNEAGKFVTKIVTGEVTPQEVANYIVGASQVGAKGSSSRLLTRIGEATGNDPEALQAIRGGVWNRLSQATEGATPKAPEKIASSIHEFLTGSGRDVAQRLFTPEQQGIMRAYADTLRTGQQARQIVSDVARTTKPQSMDVGVGPMQELANTVLGRGGKTDEALFSAIDAYAKSGGRGDIQTLAKLVRNLPAQDRGDLAGSVIRNLGISPRTGSFSPDVFVSQWRTYTPQAKSILFGNAGPHRQALDDIGIISQRLEGVGKQYGNPAGTAQNRNFAAGAAAVGGAIAALFHGDIILPMTVLGTAVGGATAARILASAPAASSAAKWARIYSTLVMRPSAHTLAAYQVASRNLINTAGIKEASTVDFLRAIQSPANGSADDQPNVPRPPGQ